MNFAFDMNKDLMLRTPNKLVCAAFHFQLELSFPSVTLGQIQELSNRDYRFHIILQMTEDTFLPFLVNLQFALYFHITLEHYFFHKTPLRFHFEPLHNVFFPQSSVRLSCR